MIYRATYESPMGKVVMASDGEGIIGLWFKGQKYFGSGLLESAVGKENGPEFDGVKGWLDRYFTGERPEISELLIRPRGSGFRQMVWEMLCQIPYGTLVTYGDIAKKIARKRSLSSFSSQAVGGAVGHNPISIIIPCHRVVGASGNLTGYAGGIDKKIKLLEREGIDLSVLSVPKEGTTI